MESGDVTGTKICQGSDINGRWSYFKLCSIDHKVIALVITYQPCKATSMANTTYHQQLALLQSNTMVKMELRKMFIKDLKGWLKQCKNKVEFIISAGEYNEVLHITSPMMTLCTDPDLWLQDILEISPQQFSTAKWIKVGIWNLIKFSIPITE
eukprot:11099946-Ditylum_brightwellii.AAC.1